MERFFFKYYYIALEKYYGSQRQKNLLTIEDRVIETLQKRGYITDPQTSHFESASRTDRYVSARGAVFSIDSLKDPILMEINAHLPKEIGIWAYSKVPDDYSPRFKAQLRHYKYIIPLPFSFLKRKYNFDLKILKKACNQLEGTHDFQNFSKRSSSVNNTVRDMKSINLSINNDRIVINFQSQAFLWQQIRRIARKLIELGKGEIEYKEFIGLLDPSEFKSYQPANPKGLILWDVIYDDKKIKFKIDDKSSKRMKEYFVHQKRQSFLQYNFFSLMDEGI